MLSRFAFASAVAAVLALSFGACSNQGEGDRCDRNASNGGNDDCQDGLQCDPQGELGTSYDACCPVDRTQATAGSVCALNQTTGVDASSTIPDGAVNLPDTSPMIDSAGGDSPAETGTDAPAPPVDAAPDSPADAPVDAPTQG